jgi:hypothetical protein
VSLDEIFENDHDLGRSGHGVRTWGLFTTQGGRDSSASTDWQIAGARLFNRFDGVEIAEAWPSTGIANLKSLLAKSGAWVRTPLSDLSETSCHEGKSSELVKYVVS